MLEKLRQKLIAELSDTELGLNTRNNIIITKFLLLLLHVVP